MTTPTEGSGTPAAGTPAAGAPTEGTPAGTPAGVEAPVEYEFVAPTGETLDTSMVATVAEIAKELKLPLEAAQKLVNSQHTLATAHQKTITATVDGWKAELAADPVLGGDKLPEHRAIANKAISLGGTELASLLEQSGMVHHPQVFKWLYAIGKTLSEDRFVAAGGQPTAVAGKPAANVLYPNNA